MRTVVITGSARGFGYEMIKLFRKNDFNVVLCDVSLDNLNGLYMINIKPSWLRQTSATSSW